MPFIITWQGGLSFLFFFLFLFLFVSLSFCCCRCCCCYFFPFFPFFLLPTTYSSLVITLLLLLLKLCLLTLLLWVFLRNQVQESSKQGTQAASSAPIHHIKWWISRFRGAYRTHSASEMELFVMLVSFGLLYVTESLVLGAVRVLHVFRHFIIIIVIFIIIIIIIVVITIIINIIFITFIIIRLLEFLIKNSLLFLWGKLKVYVCFLQFLHVS